MPWLVFGSGEGYWYAMSASSSKKTVALQLLERSSVFIHLDPRREGVVVPQGFVNQAQLVLQIGFDMAVAIPDLDVDDDGISCTLSFNRQRHFCQMPWSAIFALIGQNGGGRVWREDVPAEVLEQRAAADKAPSGDAGGGRPKANRSHLRAVRAAEKEPPRAAESTSGGGVAAPTETAAKKGLAADIEAASHEVDAAPSDGNGAAALAEMGAGAAERVDLSSPALRPKAGPRLVVDRPLKEEASEKSLSAGGDESAAPASKPRAQEARKRSAGSESSVSDSARPQSSPSQSSSPQSPPSQSPRASSKARSRPPYLRLVE